MKKTWKIILCTLLCAVLLTGLITPVVFAVSVKTSAKEFEDNKDVQAFKTTIAEIEKEQAELKSQLRNVQNKRYTAEQQSAALKNLILATEKKIETTESLIAALNVQIADKETVIAEKQAEIEQKTAEIQETRETFLLLVRAQYMNEPVNILSVILGADSIGDMLSRADYMGSLLDYNADVQAKYESEKAALEAIVAETQAAADNLRSDKTAQEEYLDSLEKEQADLELQKAGSDSYVRTLRMSEAEIQAEYEASLKAEEEENARLEKLLRELAAANQTEYVGGKFIWPVDLSVKRISSDYGWRTYYYKGRKVTDFHMGIDIPAPVGTDIYAVQDGKVILSQWHSSYGNYMIVDHGGGISTLYAHCSKLLKKVGDTVEQGDHIAEMGSTGNSTGPHLHIEVRVNGKHQDPIANGWLVQPK